MALRDPACGPARRASTLGGERPPGATVGMTVQGTLPHPPAGRTGGTILPAGLSRPPRAPHRASEPAPLRDGAVLSAGYDRMLVPQRQAAPCEGAARDRERHDGRVLTGELGHDLVSHAAASDLVSHAAASDAACAPGAGRPEMLFGRGPAYVGLSGGASFADVNTVVRDHRTLGRRLLPQLHPRNPVIPPQ